MYLRILPIITIIVIATSMGFCQESFGPESRWVYDFNSGFFHGINTIKYQKSEIIEDLLFNKFKNTQTRSGFNTDTTHIQLAPIYFRNEDEMILVSFDGVLIDTLFDFKAAEGASWTLSYPDTEITIELEVIDTFNKIINNVEVTGQLLSYEYSTGRRYVDTVLNFIGNTFGYIDPFEFILSGVEDVEGGPLRCFYHPDLGLKSFNEDIPFSYDYDCDETVTSTQFDREASQARVLVSTFTVGGMLHLNCLTCRNGRYFIYDVAGRMLTSGHLVAGERDIDLQSAKSGLYFLQVEGRRPEKFIHQSY